MTIYGLKILRRVHKEAWLGNGMNLRRRMVRPVSRKQLSELVK